ncbi:8-oxo-dGTP diphosphatase [Patescibacteria group bacterium]|nr:8-oxo-dGTP diphosphatase [Patescibacteria group bacterium]
MKKATLCLLVKENQGSKEILLAMKKKGFGAGKWNGVGGKLNPKKGDENIFDAAIRETKEEIGVKIKELEKVAILNFYFPNIAKEQRWDQEVHVFLVKNWEGKPVETKEMTPKWFKESEIPFNEMWSDDKFWLLHILKGKKLKADFIFDREEVVEKHNIKFVKNI